MTPVETLHPTAHEQLNSSHSLAELDNGPFPSQPFRGDLSHGHHSDGSLVRDPKTGDPAKPSLDS